jgi:glycosyltransferase involved in cell wall biosynthesis
MRIAMEKKVLICAAYFYPHIGGYERYINGLYSRLGPNIQVDILVSDFQGNDNFEKLNGMDIYRLDSICLIGNMYPIPKINFRNLKILRNIIKNDYIFVNTHTRFFTLSFLGFLISKLKDTKLIHTEHGMGAIVFDNYFVNLFSNIYDRVIGKMIIRRADINIGISKASCEFLEDMGANNVYLVQNGVDTNFFKKKGNDLRERLKISEEYKVITFTGRLIYAKGVQDLINCFFILKTTDIPVKLLIVGDGSYRNNLEKLSNNDEDILFLGLREDIVDILNITDILVNPSYSEGLPTSILEAASVGIPIIATDVGGTKEMFMDKMGFLIKEKDTKKLLESLIKSLEVDDDQFRELRRKYIIENYDWEKIADSYLKILKRSKIC